MIRFAFKYNNLNILLHQIIIDQVLTKIFIKNLWVKVRLCKNNEFALSFLALPYSVKKYQRNTLRA